MKHKTIEHKIRKKDGEKNLKERCEFLAKTIKIIRRLYKQATPNQKQFIETIIGAAIWYLPKKANQYWTHCISRDALRNHLPNIKAKPKLTEDHAYPRKLAAEKLLKLNKINAGKIVRLYKKQFGVFNLITPEENRKLMPFQRKGNYINWKDAYKKAGIKLYRNVSVIELNRIKNRDRKTIDRILHGR
jgi:hypothetical protein